jgi:hypothetical protein
MTFASAWLLIKLMIGIWAMSLLIGGVIETINRKKK